MTSCAWCKFVKVHVLCFTEWNCIQNPICGNADSARRARPLCGLVSRVVTSFRNEDKVWHSNVPNNTKPTHTLRKFEFSHLLSVIFIELHAWHINRKSFKLEQPHQGVNELLFFCFVLCMDHKLRLIGISRINHLPVESFILGVPAWSWINKQR